MFNFEYSFACDVWAWAITIIEVMNKGDPYPGITDMDVAIAVSRDELRPKIPPGTPQEFGILLKECWDFSPKKRPNFEQVSERMQKIVAKMTVK